MTRNPGSPASSPVDREELKYWAERGAKTAAFLLVIPGSTIAALGVGILVGQTVPVAVVGLGAGMLLWGLIVALRT